MSIFENEKVKAAFALHDVGVNTTFYNSVKEIPFLTEGIYFIWRKGGELDYIGTSGSIHSRLCVHTVYKKKTHGQIAIIEVESMGIAQAIEISLVAILNPNRNKHGRTNLRRGWY